MLHISTNQSTTCADGVTDMLQRTRDGRPSASGDAIDNCSVVARVLLQLQRGQIVGGFDKACKGVLELKSQTIHQKNEMGSNGRWSYLDCIEMLFTTCVNTSQGRGHTSVSACLYSVHMCACKHSTHTYTHTHTHRFSCMCYLALRLRTSEGRGAAVGVRQSDFVGHPLPWLL